MDKPSTATCKVCEKIVPSIGAIERWEKSPARFRVTSQRLTSQRRWPPTWCDCGEPDNVEGEEL